MTHPTARVPSSLRGAHAPDAARALTFATLVVGLLAIILVNRSWTRTALGMLRSPNAALRWVVLGASSVLGLVLFVPAARTLLHFAPLHLDDVALAMGAGALCVGWFEMLKLARRRTRS